jgi:hypothetical protein
MLSGFGCDPESAMIDVRYTKLYITFDACVEDFEAASPIYNCATGLEG